MTIKELNGSLNWEEGFYPSVRFDEGWIDLVNDLNQEILKIDPNYKVAQAKEKFGLLRFYYYSDLGVHVPEIDELIRKAEVLSGTTCEKCGQPGSLVGVKHNISGSPWLQTLCNNCINQFLEDRIVKDIEKYKPIIL